MPETEQSNMSVFQFSSITCATADNQVNCGSVLPVHIARTPQKQVTIATFTICTQERNGPQVFVEVELQVPSQKYRNDGNKIILIN